MCSEDRARRGPRVRGGLGCTEDVTCSFVSVRHTFFQKKSTTVRKTSRGHTLHHYIRFLGAHRDGYRLSRSGCKQGHCVSLTATLVNAFGIE